MLDHDALMDLLIAKYDTDELVSMLEITPDDLVYAMEERIYEDHERLVRQVLSDDSGFEEED